MSETLTIFGTQYTGVTGIKATNSSNQTLTYIIPQGNISITSNSNNIDVTNYATASVSVSNGLPTQHTVHLEFTDDTDTDISAYYSNSLISTMITAYTPTTYNNKTVNTAELDGVEWYERLNVTWETVYDANTQFSAESDDSYAYITSLSNISITEGSIWRVTWGNETKIHTAVYGAPFSGASAKWHINSTTDGTNGIYVITPYTSSAWLFIDFNDFSQHTNYVKLEQGITS